jgi:predicted DNA-binding transcriptional regulator AlpA
MNEHESTEPLTVTVPNACRITGLCNTSIYRLMNEKRIETVRVFGRRLIVFASLKAALGLNAAARAPGLTGGPIKTPPILRRRAEHAAKSRSTPES